MSDISKLSNVSPAMPAHRQEDKNLQRRMVKQHLKEIQIEEKIDARKEDQNYFEEITREQFFPNGNSLHNTQESVSSQMRAIYENVYSDVTIATNADAMTYLSGEEVEMFLKFLDVNGSKKTKFDEISAKLVTSSEGEEESIIDNAARLICAGNKAEIYLMLCYLYEDLNRKKVKEKLQDRLKKIIDAFERQESSYLFNFFSFQNILKTSPNANVNAALLDKMANISSGNIKLNSLRQSLQFIAQSLPDHEMYKMVSLFMKFQAKGLKKINGLNEGPEGKEELANLLQQERNLIILNSLYSQCKKVFKQLKKVTPIDEKYSDFMGQVITVIESSVTSVDGMQNMQKLIGVKQITLQINSVFVKAFMGLLSKMPQPIFYNEAMREKLLESIRNIQRNIDKLLEPKSNGLSFLRNKSYKNSGI
jgi:hypothetical protein